MTIVGQYENEGSMSAFYVIDNKRGFKEFSGKYEAEYAHAVQSKLETYDMAPYVLSQVGKIRMSNGDLSEWGYITEIAKTIGCGGNSCSCGECDDTLEYSYDRQICKLAHEMMYTAGVEFTDCHIGNVGFVRRNGKRVMVCIDFGSESVCDEDCPIDPYDDNEYDSECDCSDCLEAKGYNNV
jgi:hypothetical protein